MDLVRTGLCAPHARPGLVRAHVSPFDGEGDLGYAGGHVADHEAPVRSEIDKNWELHGFPQDTNQGAF